MRRTILLVVAVLTLAVVFTVPAAGAPQKAFTWNITCPDRDPFTVTAKGVPGFPLEGGPPVLLLGGSFVIYDLSWSVIDSWSYLPPPGLQTRVETCRVAGPNEVPPADFHMVVDPAYLFFPDA